MRFTLGPANSYFQRRVLIFGDERNHALLERRAIAASISF
jgi:hypothetical protein